MGMNRQKIISLFCHNRSCRNCPFSQWFRTDKFTRSKNITGCRDACGNTMEERALCWFVENNGIDTLLKKSVTELNYGESYIESVYNWCGYSEVDFL